MPHGCPVKFNSSFWKAFQISGSGTEKRVTDLNSGRFILSQVLDLVHRQTLNPIAKQYESTISVRHFGFRQQLTCMVFAQMTARDGLRDITTCLNARTETLYHLGFTEPVAKSTLADANKTRDWRIGCFCFRNPSPQVITDGRMGLRHMFTRSARYRNFRISIPGKLPD
jgi:hypothetical protein